MKVFLGSVSIQRDVLLKNDVAAFQIFIENFLSTLRFNTAWGIRKLNETLKAYHIHKNKDSILKFLEVFTMPLITLAAFQVDFDDYEFYILNTQNYDSMIKQAKLMEQEDLITPIGKDPLSHTQ